MFAQGATIYATGTSLFDGQPFPPQPVHDAYATFVARLQECTDALINGSCEYDMCRRCYRHLRMCDGRMRVSPHRRL